MAKQFIEDFVSGSTIEKHFTVVRKELLPFKDTDRGNYLTVTLADKTGRIEGRRWENADVGIEYVKQGEIIWVKARVETYNGKLQLRIFDVKPAVADDIDMTDFLPLSKRDIEVMKLEFAEILQELPDKDVSHFINNWFAEESFYNEYIFLPAAKQIHHACIGGLLEHSLEVASFAKLASSHYPEADWSMTIAGSLLHDIGKMQEYTCRATIETTDVGRLLGHTAIGYRMIIERCAVDNSLNEEKIMHLAHIVLSHHGEMAFGAPVTPRTIEAAIVHHCDLMSGRLGQFRSILSAPGGEDQNWSQYDRFLGRQLYKGFGSTEDE